jgi:hypothetical protein
LVRYTLLGCQRVHQNFHHLWLRKLVLSKRCTTMEECLKLRQCKSFITTAKPSNHDHPPTKNNILNAQ